MNNERIEDIFLVIGDRMSAVNKVWWYLLAAALVFAIPIFFVLNTTFVNSLLAVYKAPVIIYTSVNKEPLQILDKKIFDFGHQTYSGFVKLRNINLEWGESQQDYKIEFKTFGGTVVNTLNRSTFILPSSEKLLVLPRFVSDKKPDDLVITLAPAHFIRKPKNSFNFEVQRTSLQNNSTGLVVSSAFKNLTPFTLKQIELPVIVFNTKNEIVAVNFTYINDVKSSETRTFQFSWPEQVTGAVRAEVSPEINAFDPAIISNEAGVTPTF